MIKVGITELRRSAGVLIRRVIKGETIEVTKRGRPVAQIVPLQGRGVLEQMIAEGRATAASGDVLDLKPFPPVSGKRPLSEVLTDLRAGER